MGKVDRHWPLEMATITAATPVLEEVWRDEGIPAGLRTEGQGETATLDRPAALELVDGQVHTPAQQRSQGTLESVVANQPLKVPELTAYMAQERSIGAPWSLEYHTLDEGEEVGVPSLETLGENRPAPSGIQPVPYEVWELSQEPGGRGSVAQGGPRAAKREHRQESSMAPTGSRP
jgi:hypothetical protein